MNNKKIKLFLSEFLGTMILILFGAGVVAMTVVFGEDSPNGGYTNISLAWGIAVTLGIYAGQYSGAHLNPAVTLALAVSKRFEWSKVGLYITAQMLGAFIGALLVYINYYHSIHVFDPDLSKSAGIFTTFPNVTTSMWPGLFDQILGTFLLVFLILAIGDRLTLAKAQAFGPILVGLVVVAIGMSFGALHGYAINPARDLGPRLMVTLVGYQNNGLTDGSWIFIVPILGPIIGGVLGAVIYDKTVGAANKEELVEQDILSQKINIPSSEPLSDEYDELELDSIQKNKEISQHKY